MKAKQNLILLNADRGECPDTAKPGGSSVHTERTIPTASIMVRFGESNEHSRIHL